MIPGFDFSTVVNRLTYPGSPVDVLDVPAGYEKGRWKWDWEGVEARTVRGIVLFQESENDQADQGGFWDSAKASLIAEGDVPMYCPGVEKFVHPSGRQHQSFLLVNGRRYRVDGFDWLWSNTNCRSWNAVLFSEWGAA